MPEHMDDLGRQTWQVGTLSTLGTLKSLGVCVRKPALAQP
jgi:hypothetical protein